jgi:hypothetical protein
MSENPGALKYSYDILSKLCGLISKFSKDFKYSFWEKIENYAVDTVAEISLTTKVFWFDEKIQHLSTAKKDIEIINVLLKVCHDSNKISHKDYDEIDNDLNELFNQITKRENFCRIKLKEQSDLLK